MTTEIVNMLAEFLKRVDLKGSEVAAYVECMRALEEEHKRLTEGEAK